MLATNSRAGSRRYPRRTMYKLFFITALATTIVPARAGNIVLNGSFETGDFTSWTVKLAPDESTDLFIQSFGSDGNFSAAFGATVVGEPDTILQILPTIGGQLYTFSFSLGATFTSGPSPMLRVTTGSPDPVADFQVFWNDTLVFENQAGDSPGFDFTPFSFTEMATGNDTISFSGYNLPDHYFLDAVSVDAVAPEPGTWMLLGAGLIAIGGSRKFARR